MSIARLQAAHVTERLVRALGANSVVTAPDEMEPFVVDYRKLCKGAPLAVIRPASTEEVSTAVKICADAGTSVIPLGGNTGLVGGAVPDSSGRQVVISLSRLNRIRKIDTLNDTMTVEAGCSLAAVQGAASEAGRLFPLSLASEGSCQIGGNIATNAGGNGVLLYGSMRDLVLGLEVVLPSGEIWSGLRALRKDNTGYDLKHLFIGSEGTLGIITAAVLRLFPKPNCRATAIVSLRSLREAAELLALIKQRCREWLTAFEVFANRCLELVCRHFPGCRNPFSDADTYYALIELSASSQDEQVQAEMEVSLSQAVDQHLIRSAVIARSDDHRRSFWALRENVSDAQACEGGHFKHDISVPVSMIAPFVEETERALAIQTPFARSAIFGHFGDGNLHYNVGLPLDMSEGDKQRTENAISTLIYDQVAKFGGSISAEHGLGQAKRSLVKSYKSSLEIDLMQRIKAALDPNGTMNPGKVV